MKHFMHLKEAPFGQIWNGSKTIELRLYDEKRRKIKRNDFIEFQKEPFLDEKMLINCRYL